MLWYRRDDDDIPFAATTATTCEFLSDDSDVSSCSDDDGDVEKEEDAGAVCGIDEGVEKEEDAGTRHQAFVDRREHEDPLPPPQLRRFLAGVRRNGGDNMDGCGQPSSVRACEQAVQRFLISLTSEELYESYAKGVITLVEAGAGTGIAAIYFSARLSQLLNLRVAM